MHPSTHLLQLQLNDLLLKGVGFVLSLHVGFFYAVLLGTEIQGKLLSSFKTATRLLTLVTATKPSQQTLIFVFPVYVYVCVHMHACMCSHVWCVWRPEVNFQYFHHSPWYL